MRFTTRLDMNGYMNAYMYPKIWETSIQRHGRIHVFNDMYSKIGNISKI